MKIYNVKFKVSVDTEAESKEEVELMLEDRFILYSGGIKFADRKDFSDFEIQEVDED